MPVDVRQSGGGGGDDWLGDKGEIDWDADVREPGRSAPRRAATPARPPEAAAAPDPHTAAHEATIRRRRAVGLVVALLLVGGLIWLAVAAFGGDSDGTSVTTTPTTPTQTTPTQTTPEATPPATTTPRPAETIPEDERLELESTGDSVEQLQVTLKELGFDPGPVDGDFGPLTQAAVVAFQTANGLDPDGVVGSITAGALNAALAAQASG
jgi:Putative peptidoglycan binding domain